MTLLVQGGAGPVIALPFFGSEGQKGKWASRKDELLQLKKERKTEIV